MKFTLAITQQCNLACSYCYITKRDALMSHETAANIVAFMFRHTPPDDAVEIGFFGGEPLLALDTIEWIINHIRTLYRPDPQRLRFSMVTNGTLVSGEVASKLLELSIAPGISLDGPPDIQNRNRRFADGTGTATLVADNLQLALRCFPMLPVNAVYSPETLHRLPETVDYLLSLGVKNIYLNPDITATWNKHDAAALSAVYATIGNRYIDLYRKGTPCRISLIDNKIVVILRGGYRPAERCRMGKGEYAFGPSGNIYPCERLIGDDAGGRHCLGNINNAAIPLRTCSHNNETPVNPACISCGLLDYCMYWCGCTNYFSTGDYNKVGPFICASEKAALNTAFSILDRMEQEGIIFSEHLAGSPMMGIIGEMQQVK